jgi:Zn ribbon nucleic-acid-binding protein
LPHTDIYVILVVVVLVLLLRLASHFITRDKNGTLKKSHGIYGGAICPRCGRPFSRHWWAPNLVAGKFDRCPHCGKWHFSTRATPQMLARAEESDREDEVVMPEPDDGDALKRQLEESRYDD